MKKNILNWMKLSSFIFALSSIFASCSNELDEALQPMNNGNLQFVVSDFPVFGESPDTRVIGTQDVGKIAWEENDKLLLSITFEGGKKQGYTLEFKSGVWTLNDKVLASSNITGVLAVYAPDCEIKSDGNIGLVSGKLYGMSECIPAKTTVDGFTVNVSFKDVTRNYSRLRIAGLENQPLTVTTKGFTPAGATSVATDDYTLTTDDNGNAFLYGVFAVGATVSVSDGNMEIVNHAFASATEECVSYALDAMPPYVYDDATSTYTVYTAEGLLAWNEAARADLTTNLVLMADITLTGENNWTPVGEYDNDVTDENNTEYIGTINGGGHTLTGLHINNNSGNQGFIGGLGEGGIVKNLTFADAVVSGGQWAGIVAANSRGTIENCHVTSGVNFYINGSLGVGGIVGYNEGLVAGCTNNTTVRGSSNYVGGIAGQSNGTITGCTNSGTVSCSSSAGNYVGGISGSGDARAVITNCTNNGAVSGNNEYVGGIVGDMVGSVTNCTNTAAVTGDQCVGGIVGYQAVASITNCTNSGTVSGADYNVGGIAGLISHKATVIGCYNTAAITGEECVGGIAGYMSSESGATITNCYNTADVTGDNYVGGIAGYHGTDRTIANCYNTGTITATATGADTNYGGVVGYTNGGTISNCYYLNTAASGGINGADAEGQAEAKTAAEFASADMAVLLNGDQTDAPWEYIEGNAAPTLKFFNKNEN